MIEFWVVLRGALGDPYVPFQLEIFYSSVSEGGRRCRVLGVSRFSLSVVRARSSLKLGIAVKNCFQ